MEKRELTCINCPMGCQLTVTLDGGAVTAVTGQTCPRGKAYAESEVTNPVRTLTSVVRAETAAGEKMLPVRTSKPIPRPLLFHAMDAIRGITVTAPVKTGDVLVSNFMETGVDLVACKDIL